MTVDSRASDVASIANAIPNLVGLVKPQVTATSSAPAQLQQTNDQIQALLAKAGGNYQPMIDAIMQRAAIAFAPTLGEQQTSGGYNATATKQLAGEATARATSESTAAVTQAQQQAAQTAATLQESLNMQNKQVVQKAPLNVGDILKSVGVAYGANKLLGATIGGKSSAAADGGPILGQKEQYDDTLTPSGANAYDTGTGPYATGGSSTDLSAVGGSGPGVSGTSFGEGGGSSILTASEANPILAGAGEATLGNSAAGVSMTDASTASLAEAGAPYGDFGSTLGTGTPMVNTSANTVGATSDVLSADSSATSIAGASTAGDAIAPGAEAASSGATGGILADVGAAGAPETLGASYAVSQVAAPIVTDFASNLDGAGPSFGTFAENFFSSAGGLASDIGNFLGF
jgi:hypothetical protein